MAIVRDFGAHGDGGDDTQAFVDALNWCRQYNIRDLWVPAGIYGIASAIDASGVSIHGDGANLYGTQLRILSPWTGTENFAIVLRMTDTDLTLLGGNVYESFSISGDGSSTPPDVGGIRLDKFVYACVFTNIALELLHGDAILLSGTSTLVPTSNVFSAVHVDGTNDGNGITIEGGFNNTFISCTWEGLGKNGINITGAVSNKTARNVFLANWVEGVNRTTDQAAVLVQNADATTLVGLQVNSYGTGSAINTSNGVLISSSTRTLLDAPDVSASNNTGSAPIEIDAGGSNILQRLPLNIDTAELSINSNSNSPRLLSSTTVIPNTKNQIFLSNGQAIAANSTRYLVPPLGLSQPSAALGRMMISGYMTAAELRCESVTVPGASESYTITVFQNGIAGSLTATLTNPSAVGSDLTHQMYFAPGDVLSFQILTSTGAAPLNPGDLHITLGTKS